MLKRLAYMIQECEARNLLMNIACVDEGANLIAFIRMPGAWLGSIDIAIKKAKTAVMFQAMTSALSKAVLPGGPLYGIEHSNDGLITFPGGVLVIENDKIVGGIGVSGDTVDNDELIALLGANYAD